MIKENFVKLYESGFKENWSLPALTNYMDATTYSFADVAKWVAKVHLLLDKIGIKEGDKVTLIARDSAEWSMTFLAALTYGAVAIPILPDFSSDDIHNIINHSDSAVVFASEEHLKLLDAGRLSNVKIIYEIVTLKPVVQKTKEALLLAYRADQLFEERYPMGFTRDDVKYKDISNEEILLINYTSGTTGSSKGVMITGNNLAGNVIFAREHEMMRRGENMLSFLPMAHTYSCAFNLLTPMHTGTHVYILGVMPAPQRLLKAFAEVRPNLILSVPLILEKIYKSLIYPKISKFPTSLLLKIPIIRGVIRKKICRVLYDTFGGNFREFVIGGAPMNDEVTKFLSEIKFPFTIGYGMTECAPLICYEDHRNYVPTSCGKVLSGLMEIRIAEPEGEHKDLGIGEIQVRGEHVCKGYYKNPEATEALFTSDGWMRTGDLAYIDKKGNVFIKGRSKSMILGPSGQNIFPEDLEAKLALMPYVSESVVISENGQLVALVYPDRDAMKKDGIEGDEAIQARMDENLSKLNPTLAVYERIRKIVLVDHEFEKTPKRSIKRYLYTSSLAK